MDHAIWSMGRDAQLESNQGISSQYAFRNIFKRFTNGEVPEVNAAPTLKGVTNVKLTVGDTFDPMAGVTARDKEEGDLTAQVTVEGTVNTAVVGQYKLVYSVSDREGLTATATRVITVKEEVKPDPNNT